MPTALVHPGLAQTLDLPDSFDAINDYFYEQGWTDGLPIVPPTAERVANMLGGMAWRQAKEHALLALGRVGLGEVALRNARTLSGGQQQRLALARAWSLKPGVLFLDEPTSSLDPHAKREVEALMADFAAAGMTLVFASHNLGQVKRLATRVVYMEEGRVLADLPVHAFFNGPLGQTSREAELFVKGELG